MTGAAERVAVLMTSANAQLVNLPASTAIEAQLIAENPCDISYSLPYRHSC
jgi:hypothetical protein